MNTEYLVILAGSPRGGEKTWDSMFKYIVEPLNADLAIACGDTVPKEASLYKKAKYRWLFKEYDDWYKYYEENYEGNWKQYFETGSNTGLKNSGSVHFAIKDILLKRHINIIKQYKYIIYTRFDQYYIDYYPSIKDKEDSIFIPEGEDYFGVCDRYAAFPSKYASEILNICTYINSKDSLKEIPKYNNCESTYLNHLKYLNLDSKIKRTKRFQFTVSTKGDKTRWRKARYNLYLVKNLKLKYPSEFVLSMKNLIDKYSIIQIINNNFIFLANYCLLSIRKFFARFLPRKLKDFLAPYIDKE
jgi:hypothetical protein